MQTFQSGYKGIALLVGLNKDRILWLTTIGAALFAAAQLGEL